MRKYIVLVAGYEYHNGHTNIATIAKRRANYLLHVNRSWRTDPNINFILFDVRFGKIDRGTVRSGRVSWTTENNSFEAINDNVHYTSDRKFIEADTNVMSITDVYAYIQNIGATEPGTVKEFSIFGHGWRGGPVLVNTYERADFRSNGSRSSERDPWDKDGRKKDTNVTNMGFEPWLNFKNAFADDGIIWVWGCASSKRYKTVINKVLRSPEFRAKRYGRHVDTDTFSLSFSQDYADDNFIYDPLFFYRSRTAGSTRNRQFTRTLLEVKEFLIRGLVHTYAAQMAYNTGIETYAALPGTGSDYERSGTSRLRVMVVPTSSSTYGYSFSQVVRFYDTYIDIQRDGEGRNYSLYDYNRIRAWKRRP